MTDREQRKAAKEFAAFWKGKGYEKGESQVFWVNLLRDVYGVEKPQEYIVFEDQVHIDHTSFIDGTIATTRVLIEQKSLGKDLRKPIRQSDGSLLTPFQQAKRYITELPVSKHPRWVVTCNFCSFLIYDMENPTGEPEKILLENLPNEYYRMNFLVDTGDINIQKEMEISIQAGELVGRLYDAFLKRYIDPSNKKTLKSLNMLCVRLVFCLYAEDAGIFGKHNMFHDYMRDKGAKNARRALIDLFKVLDIQEDERDPYIDEDLAAFPYVNGGLFSDEDIEIPQFTDEIFNLLLSNASEDFNWSQISPTIFGAVFESTLNPETRRTGGMHYTSIENIHKVIDPLFLGELKDELEEIKAVSIITTQLKRLTDFQGKLASLTFLDPACGSGNFLTESYLSLRRLENEVLRLILDARQDKPSGKQAGYVSAGQVAFGLEGENNPIQVSIGQFYGIEINDFAATVAKTALWIAENQMMKQTEDVIHMNLDFLPLKSYANIIEGNALRLDWTTIVSKHELNYIMGNPPFVGMKYQSAEQKADMASCLANIKNYGSLDYVACWYVMAAQMIRDTKIEVAFVSTNSITQGEQTAILWKPLFDNYRVTINFAYQTFKWANESTDSAAVHCVIIGYGNERVIRQKYIYSGGIKKQATNINAYLQNSDNFFIERRSKPLCEVPRIIAGNKPVDGDFLKIEAEDYFDFITKEPKAERFIKKLVGGYEFINRKDRYVLWLVNATPRELREMPLVMARIEKVKQARLAMKDAGAIALADTPTRFRDTLNPEQYIAIPIVSSENRKYVPMGFLDINTIPTNQVQIIPEATIYHFGVLTSNVHMAWMRAVAGRLKSDYRYTGGIVYNNFPWPTPNDNQKDKIEQTAQGILTARALYPDCSLADLYDDSAMPPELRKAHQQNDRAVMEAYGMPIKETTESSCVAELMKRYQAMITERDKR